VFVSVSSRSEASLYVCGKGLKVRLKANPPETGKKGGF
jgi:hypothetical protein